MPKEPYLEIIKHHFFLTCQHIRLEEKITKKVEIQKWLRFLASLQFYQKQDHIVISWRVPKKYTYVIDLKKFHFYVRGDTKQSLESQRKLGLTLREDKVKEQNADTMYAIAVDVLVQRGLIGRMTKWGKVRLRTHYSERFISEEEFHDAWAETVPDEEIDVKAVNEIITAPEMRYIHSILKNVKGKKILDVGCGLGEVGVYLAMKGGIVTAMDISHGMLEKTQNLAKRNHVKINIIHSTIENLNLKNNSFDVIYVGNLFHHVDVDRAVSQLVPYLKTSGVMVSRDPLAYNPVIQVYRNMATEVRSKDEHPLKIADIRIFSKYFDSVSTKYLWFTTLIIFVIMAVVQLRNPNQERYWKKIEEEGNKWAFLYRPLEKLDTFLLSVFPVLNYLCWNVVIVCKRPKNKVI